VLVMIGLSVEEDHPTGLPEYQENADDSPIEN
jgi:hypothetical protein